MRRSEAGGRLLTNVGHAVPAWYDWSMTTYLVTGGAGFIGANLVHRLHSKDHAQVVVFDLLTYAGNIDNLADLVHSRRYQFFRGDIARADDVNEVIQKVCPDVVFNLAAESHVDRSIDGPRTFVMTNVVGTFELLEAAHAYWLSQSSDRRERFRFVQISTDEVFGSLGPDGAFTERSRYAPNSPYAATKAGADHLVRAYHRTYGLPAITSNCSNNYGPMQLSEKLIPLVILEALRGNRLPVYGDGSHVRDWLFVDDHCEGLIRAANRGEPGQSYGFGGRCELSNVEVVRTICDVLEEVAPARDRLGGRGLRSYRELIEFVDDRPGHDKRYAIDPTKAEKELGWTPSTCFADGLRKTIRWYVDHASWCEAHHRGAYQRQKLGRS